MNKVLGDELVAYVGELRKVIEASTPPHLDSAASCDLRECEVDDSDLKDMRRLAEGPEVGMRESKLMCFCTLTAAK